MLHDKCLTYFDNIYPLTYLSELSSYLNCKSNTSNGMSLKVSGILHAESILSSSADKKSVKSHTDLVRCLPEDRESNDEVFNFFSDSRTCWTDMSLLRPLNCLYSPSRFSKLSVWTFPNKIYFMSNLFKQYLARWGTVAVVCVKDLKVWLVNPP